MMRLTHWSWDMHSLCDRAIFSVNKSMIKGYRIIFAMQFWRFDQNTGRTWCLYLSVEYGCDWENLTCNFLFFLNINNGDIKVTNGVLVTPVPQPCLTVIVLTQSALRWCALKCRCCCFYPEVLFPFVRYISCIGMHYILKGPSFIPIQQRCDNLSLWTPQHIFCPVTTLHMPLLQMQKYGVANGNRYYYKVYCDFVPVLSKTQCDIWNYKIKIFLSCFLQVYPNNTTSFVVNKDIIWCMHNI